MLLPLLKNITQHAIWFRLDNRGLHIEWYE